MGKIQQVFLAVILLIGISTRSNSQTILNEVGNVIYLGSDPGLENKKVELSKLCNSLIEKYYKDKEIPYILLDINVSDDTTYCELGYDNIYGTSINNDIYKPNTWDQTLLGIRVKICDSTISSNSVLKLLEYGISHIESLKKSRKKSMKLGFYDRPGSASLSDKEIKDLLNRKDSDQVVSVITTYSTAPSMLTSGSE
jgi:hypothetical protein